MGDFEVVGAHLCLEEVLLTGHAVDVQVHDALGEDLVVQTVLLGVLVEEGLHLRFLEVAAEFVHALLELVVVALLLVLQVEVEECLLACLPLTGLAVAFESDLLEKGVLHFPESLLRDILIRVFYVPGARQQLLEVLGQKRSTDYLSEGMQKFSSA